MAVYPKIIIEAFLVDSWVDISSSVIGEITGSYGILGNSKIDRVADVGEVSFTLNNIDKRFSPYSPNALTGFSKGIPVRLKINYEPDTITKFYGHIDSIEINPKERTVEVTVLDYMDYLNNFPLNLVSVDVNKRIEEVVALILSGMPIQPLNVESNSGEDEFVSIFDTSKSSTKALGELNKLALSEFGYIYVKHGILDEVLVVEGRHTRNFLSRLTQIPKNGEYLLTEDSGYLLTEAGERIMLNSLQNTTFDNNMIDTSLSYGDDIANTIIIKSYPRKVDTEIQILYALDGTTIELKAGETKKIFANYRDPSQQAQNVAGKDFVNPVATTDYLMYQNSDGTGTNLTANLSVSVSYTANTAIYTLLNTGGTKGYVTKLQARGYGIYLYSPIEYRTEHEDSIDLFGTKELTIDQKYQNNPFVAQSIADKLLSHLKDPSENIESVNFLANSSDLLLLSFMFIDVGSLIYLKDAKSQIDSYYYINGIEFSINPGGIINFSWVLTDAKSLSDAVWILGTSKLGSETVLSV